MLYLEISLLDALDGWCRYILLSGSFCLISIYLWCYLHPSISITFVRTLFVNPVFYTFSRFGWLWFPGYIGISVLIIPHYCCIFTFIPHFLYSSCLFCCFRFIPGWGPSNNPHYSKNPSLCLLVSSHYLNLYFYIFYLHSELFIHLFL